MDNAKAGPTRPRLLVIGVGNEFRHDDVVGLIIVRSLANQTPDFVKVVESSGEGGCLINEWSDYENVVIIDALMSGNRPGQIVRFEAGEKSLPAEFRLHSTHTFGLAEGIELARTIEKLPKNMVIYGIEGKDFMVGEGLTPEVLQASKEVVAHILAEIKSMDS